MGSQISMLLLNNFIDFFGGNTEKYGSHVYNKEEILKEGIKEKGNWSGWVKDKYKNFVKPTSNTYREHLEGNKAMGVCPIRADNKVRFAVMDYDPYVKKEDKEFSIRINTMVRYIYSNNFPLLCFRSKSGGLHIYMFFKVEVPAKQAREILHKFLPLLNLPQATEIFPKQDRIVPVNKGNRC